MLVVQVKDTNKFSPVLNLTLLSKQHQQTANSIIYNILNTMADLQIISKQKAAGTANSFTNVINKGSKYERSYSRHLCNTRHDSI
jgi:hypothetical protein